MPTFERSSRFDREFRRISRELQGGFLAMLPLFIAALRESPSFPPALRIKRVEGTDGVWELHVRARWSGDVPVYGGQVRAGKAHVIWRRIGTHDVLSEP